MDHEIVELAKSIAWPVAIIIGVLVFYLVVRRGGVSSISATRDGVVIGMTPVDRRESSRHAMDKRIQAVDDAMALAAKRATKAMRRPMIQAIMTSANCAATKRAGASALLDPLFDACDENDFKTHLTAALRPGYVAEKVSMIRERYAELAEETALGCRLEDGDNDLPEWEQVETKIREVVESWAGRIAYAVEKACRDKIEIYTECRPQFDEAKDKYFVGVVDSCVEKNRGYISALSGHKVAA